jgi:hypothetical protein
MHTLGDEESRPRQLLVDVLVGGIVGGLVAARSDEERVSLKLDDATMDERNSADLPGLLLAKPRSAMKRPFPDGQVPVIESPSLGQLSSDPQLPAMPPM